MAKKPKTYAPPRCSITALTILSDAVVIATQNLTEWPEEDREPVNEVLLELGQRLQQQLQYAANGLNATMTAVIAKDDLP